MTDIETIANSLTPDQIKMLQSDEHNYLDLSSDALRALHKGLFNVVITPLGQAVRDYLKVEK